MRLEIKNKKFEIIGTVTRIGHEWVGTILTGLSSTHRLKRDAIYWVKREAKKIEEGEVSNQVYTIILIKGSKEYVILENGKVVEWDDCIVVTSLTLFSKEYKAASYLHEICDPRSYDSHRIVKYIIN